MLCIGMAMLMACTVFASAAYAAQTYGLPVSKSYKGSYIVTGKNWVDDSFSSSFLGMGTQASLGGGTMAKGTVKLRARAANQNMKLVKTGSWSANSRSITYANPFSVSVTYSDNSGRFCSYGQMACVGDTALTGTIQVPASPFRTLK